MSRFLCFRCPRLSFFFVYLCSVFRVRCVQHVSCGSFGDDCIQCAMNVNPVSCDDHKNPSDLTIFPYILTQSNFTSSFYSFINGITLSTSFIENAMKFISENEINIKSTTKKHFISYFLGFSSYRLFFVLLFCFLILYFFVSVFFLFIFLPKPWR